MKRRNFIKLLGLSGAAGAISSTTDLAQLYANNEEAGPIRRLLVVSHCHGWPYSSWRMRPNGKSESQPWELNLSQTDESEFSAPLKPLYPHRNRMVALDGLSLATAELDVDGNRHDTGWVHAWTGNWVDFSGKATGARSPSIDQLVAQHIGRSDRLPSLEISVDDVRERGRPINYGFTGGQLPQENDPAQVYNRIFGPSSGTNQLAVRERGALEFAHAQYKSLAPRLSTAQRDKLSAHFDLVQKLSGRIEGMANLSCNNVPPVPGTTAGYDERFDTMAELVAAAFSCDVTRVASLSLGEMPTADFGADDITDDVHKGLAHEIYDNPTKHAAMTDYLVKHGEQMARLVSLLESMPDSDGGSLMDNTLIVWGSELADGWHGYQHYCPVLLGGSWHFGSGRYLHWPHETRSQVLTPSGMSQVSGIPHQRLLVSVAQAMGLNIEHVGVEHVQSQLGHLIDCTGPLKELS
jgi:hypothetical protein